MGGVGDGSIVSLWDGESAGEQGRYGAIDTVALVRAEGRLTGGVCVRGGGGGGEEVTIVEV